MVNVIPRSGRIAAVLLGAVLVTASISIGGPAAATVAAGHGSAGHSPVAGVHALLRHGAPGGSPIPVAGALLGRRRLGRGYWHVRAG